MCAARIYFFAHSKPTITFMLPFTPRLREKMERTKERSRNAGSCEMALRPRFAWKRWEQTTATVPMNIWCSRNKWKQMEAQDGDKRAKITRGTAATILHREQRKIHPYSTNSTVSTASPLVAWNAGSWASNCREDCRHSSLFRLFLLVYFSELVSYQMRCLLYKSHGIYIAKESSKGREKTKLYCEKEDVSSTAQTQTSYAWSSSLI